MGKKRKIRAYPQKFGRKFTSHPVAAAIANLDEVIREAEADGKITEEEVVQIKQAKEEVVEAVLTTTAEEAAEEVAEVVEEVAEAIEKVEEAVKPLVKKVTKRKASVKTRATTRKKKTAKTEG